MLHESEMSERFVDPSPIVLWQGATPAAVITYTEEGNLRKLSGTQRFAVIARGGGPSASAGWGWGPFPVGQRYFVKSLDEPERGLDLVDPSHVHTADVNGDGVDELVIFRQEGGVEVHGLKRTLFRRPGGANRQMSYGPEAVHRAHVAGRDILFAVLSQRIHTRDKEARKSLASHPQSVVLRVDADGIAQVRLGDAVPPDASVLAVGALSRPGSQMVDELLVLSARGKEVLLSRHQPDGRPIGPARPVYAPFSSVAPIQFAFVPQSRRAIVWHGAEGRAYFLEPEKPVNWIRPVDVAPISSDKSKIKVGGTADGTTDPKLILVSREGIYAVNQEGAWFTWNAGFLPAGKAQPFLRLSPPSKNHRLVGIYAAGGDAEEILAVHTRGFDKRVPSLDEALAAARRFLPPQEVERLVQLLAPTLEGVDMFRDDRISKAAQKKGLSTLPTTVEAWKRDLPESYEREVAECQAMFLLSATDALHSSGERSPSPELQRWLEALATPAETTLEVYRRSALLASAHLPGFVDLGERHRLNRPEVAFRSERTRGTAVLALKERGVDPVERGTLFTVELSWGH